MKFKAQYAFTALALAIASQAGAQVIHDLPATGNSSMYFVALDDVAGHSYFSELVANAGSTTVGVLHMDDLISNPAGSWTVTLSGLSAFAATSPTLANFSAGFGGADSNATVGGGTTAATGNRRLLTSASGGSATPAFTNSQVTNGGSNYTNFTNQIVGECSTSPCTATTTTAAAYAGIANGSAGIGTQWGFPSGPSNGTSLTGTIAWDIYLIATSSSTPSAQASVAQIALHAVLDLATNLLTISGPVSAVPLPAAVWLLGSAALGLVGIGRRRKGQGLDLALGAVAA